MKIILAIILSLVLCFSAFAQTNNTMEPIAIQGTEIVIRASNTTSIGVVLQNMFVSFSGSERERFLSFLDIHISLLDEVKKNGLFDGGTREIMFYEPNRNITIKSSIRLIDEGYIVLYFNNFSSYRIIHLTQQNLKDMKDAFSKSYEFVKGIETKSSELDKLILAARLNFKN